MAYERGQQDARRQIAGRPVDGLRSPPRSHDSSAQHGNPSSGSSRGCGGYPSRSGFAASFRHGSAAPPFPPRQEGHQLGFRGCGSRQAVFSY